MAGGDKAPGTGRWRWLPVMAVTAILAGAVVLARPTGNPPPRLAVPAASTSPGAVTGPGPASSATPSGATPSRTPSAAASGAAPADGPAQLPRGGTTVFPRYRLVGFSGGPGTAAFGRLGVGDLDARVGEMQKVGGRYATGGREVMPVLELITVVAHANPGPDHAYNGRIDDAEIARYLAAARRAKALLLLNIQPGRADFLGEVQGLSRWLREPDVGLALDPEWAVGPDEVPGRVFGHASAKELNAVSTWLDRFTRDAQLPQKVMVVHQLATRIISHAGDLEPRPGVAVVLSVDGIGARQDKTETWRKLVAPLPRTVHPGFKLFFEEDRELGRLMTARQVLALRPTPEYVLYE